MRRKGGRREVGARRPSRECGSGFAGEKGEKGAKELQLGKRELLRGSGSEGRLLIVIESRSIAGERYWRVTGWERN